MKRLAVLLAAMLGLMGLPALAGAAPGYSFHPAASSVDSTCRARKKKAKKPKPADDDKGKKKKGKDDKKPYGFEL